MPSINFNGPSIRNSYMSHAQAVANGMEHTADYTVEREIEDWYFSGHYGDDRYKLGDGGTLASVLSTAIWSRDHFTVRYPLANGNYTVVLIVGENSADYAKTFSIAAEQRILLTIPKMRRGEFNAFSCETTVSDGYLDLYVLPIGNSEVHLMGMAIYNR